MLGIGEKGIIVGSSINKYMPLVFSRHHENILKKFYETGREHKINNIMHTWGLDAEGTCFSMNIFVKIIPSLVDYDIMGLIHKLNDMDYILTDTDGEITGLGKRIL